MSTDKYVMSNVRQVLMNELGLTRDVVRAEMEKIVEQTVARHLNSDQFKQFLERQVATYFKQNSYEAKQAAMSTISSIVQKHLRMSLEVPADTPPSLNK